MQTNDWHSRKYLCVLVMIAISKSRDGALSDRLTRHQVTTAHKAPVCCTSCVNGWMVSSDAISQHRSSRVLPLHTEDRLSIARSRLWTIRSHVRDLGAKFDFTSIHPSTPSAARPENHTQRGSESRSRGHPSRHWTRSTLYLTQGSDPSRSCASW